MKLFKLIRAAEWWEYKFPPILIVPYFIVLRSSLSLMATLLTLFFILITLITGAVYVSVLNDLTDIKEDALAGKKNRLAGQQKPVQAMLLLLPVFCAAVLCGLMRYQPLALAMYILAYVCFTLYSLPPFRFKKRGLAGIITDASGSQLFPTLFATALTASAANYNLTITAFLLVAVWSFCFGLRGILWHQFHDLENDKKSGLFTVVQLMNDQQIKLTGRLIILIEVAALTGIIFVFGGYCFYAGIFIYFGYLLLRKRKTNVQIILLKYTQANYCIFMNEYYQVLLPLTLLAFLTYRNHSFIILLIIGLILFPFGMYRIFRNVFL